MIDEEHLFWSRTADKSKKVLERIKAKIEIRISATPKTKSDYTVNIPREMVVKEEMIKDRLLVKRHCLVEIAVSAEFLAKRDVYVE